MSGYVTPAAPLRAFVAELVAAGVRDAVVCPGSRSTPLALALRAHPGLRVLVHVDERAAGYFALGLAKAARRPVAVLATSGTAVVNFAPAVAEAHEGRVPLVVLTADRPPELRDRGANQTTDQQHLFGRHAKWFAELPVPGLTAGEDMHARWVAARAVTTAIEAPAGPVQVNWGFREPLVPDGPLLPTDRELAARLPVTPAMPRVPGGQDLARIAGLLASAERPLLVCGPLDSPAAAGAIARLGGRIGAPILADALANLRVGPHDRSAVIARHDAIVRSASVRSALRPDVVLRFGGSPTSRALGTFILESGATQLVIDDGGWNEPYVLPGHIIRADPESVATALADGAAPSTRVEAARVDSTADGADSEAAGADSAADGADRARWLGAWRRADDAADRAIRTALSGLDEPFEGAVFAELEGRLPEGTMLYVGNSMPVRDLDAYLADGSEQLRTLGNRGVSGIDGVVSSALGAAAAHQGPVVAVVGDLSFIHDLNALVAARLHSLAITLVVVDNDGGGIFSFLPQAATERDDVGLPEHYEELFGTPHGVDVLAVAAALGASTEELEPGRIGERIAAGVTSGGVRVLRLRTDRARNVELHRAVLAAVERELDGLTAAVAGPVA